MREHFQNVVICAPYRTPVGRFGGVFKSLHAHELAAPLISEMLRTTALPGEAVEDVIFAQGYPSMEAPALGRVVALDAGLPETSGGMQLDRRCGSGLQAVIQAVMQVATGGCDLVIAGGAESMSNAPFYTVEARWGMMGPHTLQDGLSRGRSTAGGRNYPVQGGMIETAENLRRDYKISREAQDAYALESQHRAGRAMKERRFDAEIVPITVRHRKGETVVDEDEHPRPEVTLEKLSTLRPIMAASDPDATVTAGNASGQNDGAAACIVCTRDAARRYGLTPMARMVSWAVAGVPAATMGIGPVPATQKALARADLTLADVDLIELNEAFAAQVLAVTQSWGLSDRDFTRLNVNGSGISLGHPIAATGARILASLLHEMHRREARYGLETMCIGGGQGLAAVFERVV